MPSTNPVVGLWTADERNKLTKYKEQNKLTKNKDM